MCSRYVDRGGGKGSSVVGRMEGWSQTVPLTSLHDWPIWPVQKKGVHLLHLASGHCAGWNLTTSLFYRSSCWSTALMISYLELVRYLRCSVHGFTEFSQILSTIHGKILILWPLPHDDKMAAMAQNVKFTQQCPKQEGR